MVLNLKIRLLRKEGVDAALDLVEAGPSAGTLIVAVAGPPRAGLAADGTIALIMQRIVGNLVIVNVFPHRLARPRRHRVELHDVAPARLVKRINLHDARLRA